MKVYIEATTMEDESTSASGMINWLAKLTRKITSGKIVSMHYGEHHRRQ
jgi:hypothetical protein